MKTYKHLFEDMTRREKIRECVLIAAKGKTGRPEVARILKPERDPGDDAPPPRCFEEHIDVIQNILLTESYEPPKHRRRFIIEPNCGKEREIIRPVFVYEQIIHQCVVEQIKPIIMHGLYEHAIGSIPGRGVHSGAKTIRKWIDREHGRKFYVLKGDIRHCFTTIDTDVLKKKLRQIIKDEPFLRLCDKILDCEAESRAVEDFLAEIAEEVGEENALAVAREMASDEYLMCGVPLGFVTSHWLMHLDYKEFDHKMKEERGAHRYMRYADDFVVFGRNKKELHKTRQTAETYLEIELHQHMKRNWQIFRFEYVDKRTGKTRGRALDFMGFVFHHNRTTLRASILLRSTRKARRIAAKDRPTWYDASAMLSYMGWYKHTDTYGYYAREIKPRVNVRELKKTVGRHGKKEAKRYDRMVQSTEHGQAGRV